MKIDAAAKLKLEVSESVWFDKPALEVMVFSEKITEVTRRLGCDAVDSEAADELCQYRQGLGELLGLKRQLAKLEASAREKGYLFLVADPCDNRRAAMCKRAGFYLPKKNAFYVKYLG